METGKLEIELPGYIYTSTMKAEAREPGEPPTRIFDIHDLVEVYVEWSLPLPLARMICGTFECDLFLESQGKGEEFELEGPVQKLDASKTTYSAVIKIPPDRIVPAVGETDIPYKLTATVIYKDQLGRPGPIAGFVELPLVEFYKDAP
jgi:hypothetical protein